jgi:hypothetical protein
MWQNNSQYGFGTLNAFDDLAFDSGLLDDPSYSPWNGENL